MHARISTPRTNSLTTWLLAVLGVGLLLVLLLSFALEAQPASGPGIAGEAPLSQIAYLQFGISADTLYLADPADPRGRRELFAIPHAPEYGIVPSVSPSGDRFAYTALPAGFKSPVADSPAGLWVAGIDAAARPRLLAEDVDLLVEPVWTGDGAAIVYRRTTPEAQVLAFMAVDGGEERILAYSDTAALFPVGFTPNAGLLYYVALDEAHGSRLMVTQLHDGTTEEVRLLSPGLTRDWTLSPGAQRLAFLEVALAADGTTSRAWVLDIGGGALLPVTPETDAAFSPVWDEAGALAVGVIDQRSGETSLMTLAPGATVATDVPTDGFAVPLSFAPAGGSYVARSFENASVSAPGKSSLTLRDAAGQRQTIATGEVTFVGWTAP